jgi:hypothetical protein
MGKADRRFEIEGKILTFNIAHQRGYIKCGTCMYWQRTAKSTGKCMRTKDEDIMYEDECCRKWKSEIIKPIIPNKNNLT